MVNEPEMGLACFSHVLLKIITQVNRSIKTSIFVQLKCTRTVKLLEKGFGEEYSYRRGCLKLLEGLILINILSGLKV